MTTALLVPAGRDLGGYIRRPITRDDYYALSERGAFFGKRVRLIGGEVWEMPPQSNLHGLGIALVIDALTPAFSPGFWVRCQLPLDLSPVSVPEPDAAVVQGDKRSYHGQRANPMTALLIVEVSDSTLSEDRNWMASLYASAGIADYWILNIPDRQLEIRRDPVPDATQPFGHGYASLVTLRTGEFAAPLAAPNARVAVADLLSN